MKKIILSMVMAVAAVGAVNAQNVKSAMVPAAAKAALLKKYPMAGKATWEKEKANYEANWGGKSGEDMSVQFTPAGEFVEEVVAINPSQLPQGVASYIKQNYKVSKIKEAGKVTDASGLVTYEAEVKGKDLVFDTKGNFLKKD
ncbi:Putative beta-lactamase-inhibitor-like, PepSY-like [Mucilaginibacter pineti]|uniref:Putative beta-lactamase-inhibitor-like, PepSY-like n=1 Tax=Mucilaginibacter pineti TaxID=1391627 RepID=A0A1G7M1S6_9SPHI|nr:PepSY-like domain-containing protein [Mucilaginibacter pineti]SDF55584.1 Putative beta-lactamase-inhibitor-like, PepSY-like [Mucilaginibacter pineti]